MTVQEQSLLIPSYHITVTLDIQFSTLTLLGFARVMDNGQELLQSVRKVCSVLDNVFVILLLSYAGH